jgi:hypothetical protein
MSAVSMIDKGTVAIIDIISPVAPGTGSQVISNSESDIAFTLTLVGIPGETQVMLVVLALAHAENSDSQPVNLRLLILYS